MTATRKLSLLVFALLAALLLTFAACGGDDDGTAGDDTDATATEQADDSGGDDDTPAPESDDDDENTPEATEGSGDADGGGDLPEIDVCELVTLTDAREAIGLEVPEGTNSSGFGDNNCSWEIEELGAIGGIEVSINTGPYDDREYYYELTDPADAEELDLGDRSQYHDIIGLEVLNEDYSVTINIINFDLTEEEKKANMIALAEKILERL